ncbi:uncharacterized protein LOC114298423 [Camellia sinensis]|uniref:uncharacterized protein LOC114298423 n=1 Tax=Camellia sinensis TaxID=4442 RepID=UPI001036A600|nr:uncharacterized protein LOC114298423 [Camellia sinensis]
MAGFEHQTCKGLEEKGLSHGVTIGDSPLQISHVKLDSTNYLIWFRSCSLAIAACHLTGYIDGTLKQPADDGDLCTQWIFENALVMTWLINSIQPTLSQTFLLLDTIHKIWIVVAVARMYSKKGSDAQAYELRKKVWGLDQKDRSLVVYYAEFSGLW